MYRSFFCFILLSLIILPCLALSQLTDEGGVDWKKRVITASGYGVPNRNLSQDRWRISAIEAARIHALAQLLETTKGLDITSKTTVENFTTTDQKIKTRIEGILQNFKVIATRDLEDGAVEVEVAIPLDGDLSNLFIPETTMEKTSIEVPEEKKVKEPDTLYTGLIVDARGLQVKSAMLPKIVNEDGEEIYGTGYVSRDYAVSQGIVGYSKDLEKAREHNRVKDSPIIVKGIKATGPRKTDLVISNDDAYKLHSMADVLRFMQQCKVMLVID